MILSGGGHPQLPGPQASETKHNTAASFPKQNTILRLHFRNRTQYCGFISETKHNTAASFQKQNTIAFRSRCFNHNHK